MVAARRRSSAVPAIRSATVTPRAPARAAIISLDGSLRPRSTSDRYWGEIPARSAVCASVSSRSVRSSRRRLPSTSRHSGSSAWLSSGKILLISLMTPL